MYPLEKQFVFIHKPPILIRFNEIDSVEFQRYAGGQGSTRNFDLCVNLKASAALGAVKDYTFSGIDRSDYAGLYNFLSGKKISIKNLQGSGFMEEPAPRGPVYNEDEIFGGPVEAHEGEEVSEDEDYDEQAAAQDEEPDSEDSEEGMDDDELGSEIDDELDSDLEEHRSDKKPAGKKKKKREREETDSDDDEKEKPKKKKKAKRDPSAPKRAMSGYMFFSNANREKEKEKNPDLSFGELVSCLFH